MRRASALVLGSALLGCAGDEMVPLFTTLDSAGVVLASSGAPAWGEEPEGAWSVLAEPRIDLTRSGSGPGHQFYRVADATRLPDGRIAVANAGSSEIRLFSGEGSLLEVAGREGEGPGEYQQISSVDRIAGDSLVIYSWPSRVTILDSQLQFVRSFELDAYASAIHPFEDGSFLTVHPFPSVVEYEGDGGLIRPPAPLVHRSSEGAVLDTIAIAAGHEEFMFSFRESRGAAGILFGKTVVVASAGNVIVTGSARRMEFSVLDSNGVATVSIRVPDYSLAISGAELEAEREAYLGPEPSVLRRHILQQMPIRDGRPAYSRILIDAEGYYWVGEHVMLSARSDPRGWEVFAPEGRWLGRLETPAKFEVFEIGADYILGVQEDGLEVEHVQVLELAR